MILRKLLLCSLCWWLTVRVMTACIVLGKVTYVVTLQVNVQGRIQGGAEGADAPP